jgi:hypothetical protein
MKVRQRVFLLVVLLLTASQVVAPQGTVDGRLS